MDTSAVRTKFGQFLGRAVRVRWRTGESLRLATGVLRWSPPYLHLHRAPLAPPKSGDPWPRRAVTGYFAIDPATIVDCEEL
jgi:hypothetical protein